jgi:hypothetical protein
VERTCPECGKETIKRSKFPPRNQPDAQPGWYCYAKIGGCGANFAAEDIRITEQEAGQIENTEPFDLVNTLQKMAQKRALVAAVLVGTGASQFFTQDIEDMQVIDMPSEPVIQHFVAQPKQAPASATPATQKPKFDSTSKTGSSGEPPADLDHDDEGKPDADIAAAFESPEKAIAWAVFTGAFGRDSGTLPHARAAYNKIKIEQKPKNTEEMATLWRKDVARRLEEVEHALDDGLDDSVVGSLP